jgi:hypothetical protein
MATHVKGTRSGASATRAPRSQAWILATLALGAVGAPALAGQTPGKSIEQLPAELETRWALSALPPAMREEATVFLLDPRRGYQLSREGTNGLTCIVQRTAWELADYRDDIYIPLCYDAAGTETYLRVMMDAAALRAGGMGPDDLKAEIERRYRKNVYGPPDKAGVSYMMAPIFRTIGPPDLKVHTNPMPHLMFYAPFVTNEDIGAAPDLADMSSLRLPFIDRQGIAEQSYIIQLLGEAETARIFARERALLDDLCAYRAVLCLQPATR